MPWFEAEWSDMGDRDADDTTCADCGAHIPLHIGPPGPMCPNGCTARRIQKELDAHDPEDHVDEDELEPLWQALTQAAHEHRRVDPLKVLKAIRKKNKEGKT